MSSSSTSYLLKPVNVTEHLEIINKYESESYPEDEAATYEKLKYRLENANSVFRGYFTSSTCSDDEEKLIGFVCGTKTQNKILTHDTMSVHDPSPNARTLCIHSVVIQQAYRKKGLGLAMLKSYLQYLKDENLCDKILLLSKSHLIHFYESAGFILNGESNVVHGQEKWYELEYKMN
ncbi:acetyltransferase [Naegleria gruberi]|uniref:Acetyltransferase n=1 Tax=Naegleria gruberi TaxID=5762 RepID=D2VVI7_NAEGR|nr:acetyltransferase [Naegleria gruberi]EFC39120.1 acetyltransferase [Naegleria gruberi]|eukprot:XP_002671864.1 acetyltransferase [Naegleria gruberi strain NEG-M]